MSNKNRLVLLIWIVWKIVALTMNSIYSLPSISIKYIEHTMQHYILTLFFIIFLDGLEVYLKQVS